jgi:hypothetical protein
MKIECVVGARGLGGTIVGEVIKCSKWEVERN